MSDEDDITRVAPKWLQEQIQPEWTAYNVHLTKTCDKEHPRLITQVETTAATKHDSKVTKTNQDDLAGRELLPKTQIVDEGYMETDLLVNGQKNGVDLVGPMPRSKSWQDRTVVKPRPSTGGQEA